ncbi:MAG: methionyl-tRNA formyltransferase [Planctomycetota bacterium]
MRIILMGTGPFAVPSFEAIRAAGHETVAVFTRPMPAVKSRKGPPPAPVRQWACEHRLAVFDPDSINDETVVDQLESLAADLMVVCDYGQILKAPALASTRLGGINLHGSLLPAYRGAAPVQRALLAGEPITGVSVIHMTPRLDGGPILATQKTEIDPKETAGQLEERLSALGVPAVVDSLAILQSWDGESVIGEVQDPDAVTKAPRLHKSEAEIDWTATCKQIDCLVRGMQPWPIAFTQVVTRPDKPPVRVAVKRVASITLDNDDPESQRNRDLAPGDIAWGDGFRIRCGDGVLVLDRIQPAGKREMDGEEFVRGHRLKPGLSILDDKTPSS